MTNNGKRNASAIYVNVIRQLSVYVVCFKYSQNTTHEHGNNGEIVKYVYFFEAATHKRTRTGQRILQEAYDARV